LKLESTVSIKQDLEPEWAVESPQEDKRQQRISASDRRLLGVSKIGNYTGRDLAWGRNSALSRLTGRENIDEIPELLAEAERKVLSALQNLDLDRLTQVIQDVEKAAEKMGLTPASSFRPAMDPERINVNIGAIALFDGNLPFHVKGAGSCRLLAMAIHRASVKEGSIILVDEIENSLEPYRLRQLIRELRPKSNDLHQVIFTTHSCVTVVECIATELYVVRSNEGKSMVYPVESSLQHIVRKIPEAFLARSVIVCEGKTEAGLCHGLDTSYWQMRRPPLASVGVSPIESPKGGGSEAPQYAVALAKLGYRAAYLGDSDRDLNPSKEEMEQQGIEVILWEGGLETERRVCFDLPLQGLQELIKLAIALEEEDDRPGDAVWRKIHEWLNSSIESQPTDFRDVDQLKDIVGENALREAIGKAADDGKWFKRMDKGVRLGNLLANYLIEMQGTETEKTIETIGEWCYA